MRRAFCGPISAILAVVCLSGCGAAEDKAGGTLVRRAREEYVGLDSARVIMTDMETGEEEQCFTFKYDEKDTLIFSYYGKSENSEYAQFNNGLECFTYDNGEMVHSTKGEPDFVRYTRTMTHPQADVGLLIYTPQNIISASEDSVDGGIRVTHVYDAEQIGAQTEEGEVTGFTAEYFFDEDGELEYFTETTEAQVDGRTEVYAYKIEITEKNCVGTVENTVRRFMEE